jgi:glycosyltransferase involved in cell wall biosynthesis
MEPRPDHSENLKIAIFATHLPPPPVGGAETTMLNLARFLHKNGDEIDMHVLRFDQSQTAIRNQDFSVTYHRCLNLYNPVVFSPRRKLLKILWHLLEAFNLLAIIRVIRILNTSKPDVVLTHNLDGWSWAPWIASRIIRIPIAQYVHDFGAICVSKKSWTRKTGACRSICLKCKLRVANSRIWLPGTLFFNSKFVWDRFNELAPSLLRKRRMFVVHPLAESEKPTLPLANSFECKEIMVGYIGRISPEKGVETLLEAGKKLRIKLIIAGDGTPEYVRELFSNSYEVQYLGPVQPEDFFKMVDVVVVPSIWPEPFGKVAVEALVANKITVVSDAGGLSEAAKLISQNFFLFDAGSSDSLKSAICDASNYAKSRKPNESLEYWERGKMAHDNSMKIFLEQIVELAKSKK